MTPERWEQVKNTLVAALERDDTAERISFLQTTCADDTELRREVETLLAQPDDEFESCAQSIRSVHEGDQASANTGRRIGAYELVRELGRGGMGTVWLAQRADRQYEKLVAIKLLKRGTDTDEVLRRFHAERQILARLDHPNIARLFDGGTTDDGLPYFVMEYVEGARVTDHCFAQNLSLGERLGLFRKICATVQFAHQNLVVHRDLKPGNILITAEGEPKLLDFGIAKLLAPGEDAWEMTLAGRECITPAYASPEQVRGEPVTTVSDVYALGGLLYEILTDRPPYRFDRHRPLAHEIVAAVCEQEPPRPSQAAGQAHTRREFRGDLDNIVLRAMAKNPERRYASANNLADDLRRYQEGRPVRARPDTFGYRAKKFLGRNKTGVSVAAVVALAMIAGVVTIVWEARRADRRFQDVRRLANSFLFEFDDSIANLAGSTPARRLIVSRALQYLDSLAQEASHDRPLQLELAQAYLKIGDVQGKPYTANLGDSGGATASYTKALQIAEPLAAREPGGKSTSARRIVSLAHQSLGDVLDRMDRVDEAARHYEIALGIGGNLLTEDPAHADEWRRVIVRSQLGLGDAIMARNHLHADPARYQAALDHYRTALPAAEQLVGAAGAGPRDAHLLMQTCARIAAMLSEIGGAHHDAAIFQEAFSFHQRALELDEEALRHLPESVALRRSLADELVSTSYAHVLAAVDLPAALAQCRRAIEIEQQLAAADPNNVEARQDLAHAQYVAGRVAQLQGDVEAARQSYAQSLAILAPLIAAHPDNVETAFDAAQAKSRLAELQQ